MRIDSNFIPTELISSDYRRKCCTYATRGKTPPEELDIELEGKKLTQGDSFVYIGRALCGDGNTEKGVGLRRRAQASANTRRAVDGVMADRRISKGLKGKVTSTCVM